jgi:hypothetical protein
MRHWTSRNKNHTNMGVEMKRFKLAAVMLGALFALLAMAATASAVTLPDISVTLTGGTYPVTSTGSLSAATKLASASGVALEGTGVTLLLVTKELSALGTFTSDFTKVIDPNNSKECSTTGDATGVVLIGGEFHLVPLENAAPSKLGILFLVSEATITCGTLEVVVRGNVIGSVNGIGSEGTELTGFGGVLEGKEGKQNISEYFNDGGTKVKAKLESESGAGFVGADENVAGEVKLAVEGSKMVVISPR